MAFVIVTIFLFIPYAVLLFYYRKSWLQIKDYKPSQRFSTSDLPFLSIIIPARNEQENIGDCIQSIINQSYPADKFEVIVVNDHSTDNTVSVINSFQKEHVRVINLADFMQDQIINSYKKKSIEIALRFCKGDLIVTTDADCVAPPQWLETIASFYTEKKPAFIAMPVSFVHYSDNSSVAKKFFAIFQLLDFMTLQGITGASVSKNFHSMCNGANLAYEKKVFYEVNGFEGIDEIASGDDMLLMHKIQKKYPERTLFLKSQNVIVQTKSEPTIKKFLNQRIRWASKSGHYSDKKIMMVLLLVYLLNAWIFWLALSSIFFTQVFFLFLATLVSKTIVELIFLFPVAQFFKSQKILWWFIPAQPFHILYTLIAGWLGKFGSYNWKGRKVK
ncbi:MAG: glycosyltransferase [Ginsengibacter sp.]